MRIIPINDVFNGANDWANAHTTGAKITPDEFNRIVVDEVYNFVQWIYGLPTQYRPGSPVPAVTFEENQLVRDYLEKLKVAEYKMKVNAEGKGDTPEDYLHKTAIRYLYFKKGEPTLPDGHICDECCADPCQERIKDISFQKRNTPKYTPMHRPVKVLNEEQYQFALCSVNRTATKEYPVCVFRDAHVQFAPVDLKQVLFSYLRYPKKPVFTYDQGPDGSVIFNPTGTYPIGNTGVQDIELPLIVSKYISAMVAARVGFFNRDMPLSMITQTFKAEGK